MKIAFAGTPDFAASHLHALVVAGHRPVVVVSQPDKPGKRGSRPVPGPVVVKAQHFELCTLQPARLKASDLARFAPDLLIVVAFGQILRAPVLELPRHGCINVHASLLPRWRGAAPIQRAILAGDRETGICIMQMDAGLDTGDVLAAERVTIDTEDTAGTLTERLSAVGCRLLVDTVTAIEAGSAITTPQSATGVTYAHKIDKAEAAIDWRADAGAVARHIRAFNPDPVAYSMLGDLRLKFWTATADDRFTGSPGEILSLDRSGLVVACGRGAVRVTGLQLPRGKGRVQSGADLANAWRDLFVPGTRIGDGNTP